MGTKAEEEDTFRRLFWDRLCRIHRYIETNRPELRDYPIDGITEPENRDKGHLGIGENTRGSKALAEKRLEEFEREGLVQIIGRNYRLTLKGEQFCKSRPPTEG
ncbi:MAG: hypothetical protein WA667_17245 [Candidatus Nitrosopolaris sp.]